jgi:predicted CopG family antitoxin
MNSLSIYTKLESLPKDLKQEVSDFIDFLVQKKSGKKRKITPIFGSAKGKIKMAPDFDAPLDDFNEYM